MQQDNLGKKPDKPTAAKPGGSSRARILFQALRITAIYFIAGCLWILLSDNLVSYLFHNDPDAIVRISIAKGWLYVLLSAVLIFFLTYPALRRIAETQDRLRQSNQDLQTKQSLLRALIDSIPDKIFYKDRNSRFLGCNKAFEEHVGKTESELIGRTEQELVGSEAAEAYIAGDIEILRNNRPLRSEEVNITPNGQTVYLETLKTPYYDPNGQIIGIVGISRDVSERRKREEEIQFLNYHDTLTGLYNRAFLETERQRLDTERQLPLSVIMGDINGLKMINDALGHNEGDRLLVTVADILRKCCRSEDIVARVGGDEFCILLPRTDLSSALQIVDRIKESCQEYMENSDTEVPYTNIALGCATKTEPGQQLSQVEQQAETFMYKRKILDYKSLHSSILASIKTTMFEKSNETEAHAERLATLSKQLGAELGLSDNDLVALELLSTLHDIGKISIDKNILTKAGRLDPDEWVEIRRHPEVGYRITQASPELRHISEFILCHHERWDGTGYPQGLAGEAIPLLSRILAIVDSYDAMTQDRSYRKSMSQEEAIAEIERNAGTQFDPAIAQIFLDKVLRI